VAGNATEGEEQRALGGWGEACPSSSHQQNRWAKKEEERRVKVKVKVSRCRPYRNDGDVALVKRELLNELRMDCSRDCIPEKFHLDLL
jgi:hypothetical protein